MSTPIVCPKGERIPCICHGNALAYSARMRRVCMWCFTTYEEVALLPTDPAAGNISHGACPQCCVWCGKPAVPGSNTCTRCGAQFAQAMNVK